MVVKALGEFSSGTSGAAPSEGREYLSPEWDRLYGRLRGGDMRTIV